MDNCDAMPTAHSRRRRRKSDQTKQHRSASSSSRSPFTDVAKRQDAELENEVDAYLNDWGPASINMGKRQRRVHGESKVPESVENETTTKVASESISRSLPVLLHRREVGFSRRHPRRISDGCDEKAASLSQWISQMLKTDKGGDNDDDDEGYSTTHHPATNAAFNISQWNALQYSSPTYYRIGVHNNYQASLSSDDNTTSCCAENTTTMSNNSNIQLHLQAWRPYTRRRIPFSKLKTPLSDA